MNPMLRALPANALATLLFVAAACSNGTASTRSATGVAATPNAAATATSAASGPAAGASCSGRATPAETAGPYFKPGSPERTSLVDPGMAGTRLTVSGRVTDLACHPLAGAVLDFWQADASGNYDNSGYRLRGHQATDADGRYSLLTVVPGEYPGRTPHIHVNVAAPGRPTLTTQLYFPGAARNASDSIFDPALLMNVTDAAGGKLGTYDFVLAG